MWGVDAGALRSRLPLINANLVAYVEQKRNDGGGCCLDQRWLADVVWPLIADDDIVEHDAFHCGEYSSRSVPFPLQRDYHGDFVGLVQDTSADAPLTNGNVAFWPEYRRHGEAKFPNANPEHCRRDVRFLYG